ncbi:glycosyltransferase family A protein [Streptomyces sp. LHD-70]|uniref:glycosyltransferase family 2 protein n=1 Tax=Streptomyces sp. LHD-70 TaxID=3072140 RepID=UPI00280F427F|nr:glycosyltransferase family A protein [Streptomyces sp. LHD-70]MDQ8706960.1 glycosyltransferase family A protein [Streptomyces sp. LHD-70]
MTVRPSIGVIIPACDAAEYIDQALASVAAQRQPVDEVVVFDDGSSDNTGLLAARWAGVLPMTVIRSETRSGIWRARQRAIAALESDVVLQLDADDFLLPHHVSTMYSAYLRHPGLISPRPLVWNGVGAWQESAYRKNALPLPGDQLEQLLVQNYVVVGGMYSKELYAEAGGYQSIDFCEDWDLWLRMVAAGATVHKPREATYVYRVRENSVAGLMDRQAAESGVLTKFLAGCDRPRYRRAAKISLLQRIGARHIASLPEVVPDAAQRRVLERLGVPVGRVRSTRADPDLGLLVEVPDDELPGAVWTVVDIEAGEVLVRGRLTGDALAVDFVGDESLVLRRSSLRDTFAAQGV